MTTTPSGTPTPDLIERNPKDWLFDGHAIKGDVAETRFRNLDWSNGWIDLGPSVAGNPGPYWHVPLKETVINGEVYDLGDTTHRLYPKLPKSRASSLVYEAVYIFAKKLYAIREKTDAEIATLRADRDRLREALERLGSMKAFTFPRIVDRLNDEELIARIDFAREALQSTGGA